MLTPARADAWLFGVLLTGGGLAELALKPPLYRDAHALGMHAVALLIPYVAATAFVTWAVLARKLDRRRTAAAALLFALLVVPFADLLARPIVHFEGDDSYRYSIYARNMLQDGTLWGSDALVHGDQRSRTYLDQPGYRYYVAAAMAVTGGEHRGLQLANQAVLLAAMVVLFRALERHADRRRVVPLAILLLLSAPYAAKNVLYCYSEWLTVASLGIATWASLTRRAAIAFAFLALVPFLRQNLLLMSLSVAAVTTIASGRWHLVAIYVAVLGLPVYHNLYYAGQWRFLVEQTGVVAPLTGALWKDVLFKLGGYAGYMPGEKALTLLTGLFFAPFGAAYIVREIARDRGWRRVWLVVIGLATLLPTLAFGSGSYPRFEFVNVWAMALAFVMVDPGARPKTA